MIRRFKLDIGDAAEDARVLMAQTVVKTDIKREPGFLYYVKKGDIWSSPMKKPGSKSAKGKAKVVAATGVETDYTKYLYFVGTAGGKLTVERTKRK